MTLADASPQRVLLLGPDPTEVGGMATVTAQMLALEFEQRIRLAHFPPTPSGSERDSPLSRVRRHGRHLRKLRRELQTHPVDVVHIHTCSGFSFFRSGCDVRAAKRGGARVVLHIHGARFDEFCREAGKVTRRGIRWILESADRVIALSGHWAQVLRSVAPRASLAVIPNAVEVPSAAPHEERRGACRFLLLAKMDEWKGIDDLLLACGSVAHSGIAFELILAGPPGSAGDRPTLERKIADLGLSECIVYAGPVVGPKKDELLRWADVYVQPSHHEGLPISVLEAMSHALPVIATNVGALPEVIDDGVHGRIVSPGRPDLLAQAMSELATCPTLRTQMGAMSRRRVEESYSLDRFRHDLAALYASLGNRLLSSRETTPLRSSLAWGEARSGHSPRITRPDPVPSATATA